MSLACGPEQFAVLPTLAVSGAVVVATVAYRGTAATVGRDFKMGRKYIV